nr:hypothetical protein [Tanacetum cinerariifolium]
MVAIDDHNMIETGEGLISTDVLDVVEDSNTRAHEEIDVSDNESYRYDPDFAPTPNGTPYWRPDLPEDEKPKLGDIFDTFDDGYNMYKVYYEKCRAGKVRSKFDINTLKEADADDEEKDGPTLAHRLKVALMGGYDKVRGTPGDYKNFKRAVNLFIGDRDAQMIVDKMINRQLHVLEFSFEHHVLHDELGTLLFDETEDSYCWMLKAFLKVHQKQPKLALTDQDAALRNAVVTMFHDFKHRLCMWHITQKLPGKVLGNLDTDSEFRKQFHKLIWNVHIGPSNQRIPAFFKNFWTNIYIPNEFVKLFPKFRISIKIT